MPFPDQIGRYEYRGTIGVGGFASVARCYDGALDSLVAVKVLSDTWAVDPEIRGRFVQEAKLLRRIHNEHVVTVHDSGELDDGRPYFVMDYADRGTLEDRLGFTPPGRPIDPKTTRRVVLALTDGLAALHRAGIVHRDIKPGNLLLQSVHRLGGARTSPATEVRTSLIELGERVLIGDLGLAKDLVATPSEATIIGGTQGFQPPEQREPDAVISPAADVYAAHCGRVAPAARGAPTRSPRRGPVAHRGRGAVAGDLRAGLRARSRASGSRPSRPGATRCCPRSTPSSTRPAPGGRRRPGAPPGSSRARTRAWPPTSRRTSTTSSAAKPWSTNSCAGCDATRCSSSAGRRAAGSRRSSAPGSIPAVTDGALPGSEGWRVALFTPGHSTRSASSTTSCTATARGTRPHARRAARQSRARPARLGDGRRPLLLCIDQFEELFTLCGDPDEQAAFIEALAAHLDPADSRSRAVLVIRADFYGACARVPVARPAGSPRTRCWSGRWTGPSSGVPSNSRRAAPGSRSKPG